MPRLPRRQRRKQMHAQTLAELDDDLKMDLEHGHGFFDEYPSREAMEAGWEAVGEEMLRQWQRDRPGYRPLAWWIFDHGKERPIVAPWATAEFIAQQRAQSRFGFLSTTVWSGGPDHKSSYLQQHETAYLLENNLLDAGEFDLFIELLRESVSKSRAAMLEWKLRHEPNNPRLLHAVALDDEEVAQWEAMRR